MTVPAERHVRPTGRVTSAVWFTDSSKAGAVSEPSKTT